MFPYSLRSPSWNRMEQCNIQRIFRMSETDRPRSLQPKEARRPEKSAEPSKSKLTHENESWDEFGTPRFDLLSTYAAQAPEGPATLHQQSSWNLSSSQESIASRCFHGNGQNHPSPKGLQRGSPKSHIPHGPQYTLIQRIASVSGACAICLV